MRTVSDILVTRNDEENIYNLAERIPANPGSNFYEGLTIASRASPERPRVKPKELELAYIYDSIIFNGINKCVQTIMCTDYEIAGGKDKYRKLLVDFFENIGDIGMDQTFHEWLTYQFWSEMVFGWAWNQFIFNKRQNLIIDIDIIDAKTMDYAKEGNKKIVKDEYGRPVGYIQELPISETIPKHLERFKKVPKDSSISLKGNQIFIPSHRIGVIKLYQVGSGFYPLGLIETIYKTSLRKLNMEEALANSIYTMGFPIKVGYIGDERHNPTPAAFDNLLDKLKKIDYKGNVALPYWEKLDLLEPKRVESLNEQFSYFEMAEVTGMGIPKPFVTGSGMDSNRNSMDFISDLFNLTLREIVVRTTSGIRKRIFKKIILTNTPGLKSEDLKLKDIPELKFGDLGVMSLDKQADRLKKYAKAEVLPEDRTAIIDKITKKENLQ